MGCLSCQQGPGVGDTKISLGIPPMRGFFSNKTVATTSHIISKLDKKKINVLVNNALDLKQEYRLCLLNNRSQIIRKDDRSLYFQYYGKIFPTIRNFDKSLYKCVCLDSGAVGPLSRGADVMAPGILKYESMSSEFSKDDIVGVEIIEVGVFAVGLALMSSAEMRKAGEGSVISILHIKGDALDEEIFK